MKKLILFVVALLAAPLAFAQGAAGFPSKPIRIYVPFNAGSGSDRSRGSGRTGDDQSQTFVQPAQDG